MQIFGKKWFWIVLALSVMTVSGARGADIRVNVFTNIPASITAQTGGLVFSVGNEYYAVPQQEVVVLRQHGVPDSQIPLVFLASQRANVQPVRIVQLRRQGMSWQAIGNRFNISPQVVYVKNGKFKAKKIKFKKVKFDWDD